MLILSYLHLNLFQDGRTNLANGINYVRMNSFEPAAGGRSDAQKVVVVITDGTADDPAAAFRVRIDLNPSTNFYMGNIDTFKFAYEQKLSHQRFNVHAQDSD